MNAARGKILELTGAKKFSDTYFTQVLLPDYTNEKQELVAHWDVVYDARGNLTEPHTGSRIPLGTIQVRTYLGERAPLGPAVQTKGPFPTPHVRARQCACPGAGYPPHTRADGGSPIKRMRKAGITDPITGELVRFPYMPRVAELPRGWRNFGPAQKVEHLLNMSLDRAAETLSWGPVADLDAHRLHVWLQVWRVVFMIGTKAHFDGRLGREAPLERNRERIFAEMSRELEALAAARPGKEDQ
jgi:hypothetical protein